MPDYGNLGGTLDSPCGALAAEPWDFLCATFAVTYDKCRVLLTICLNSSKVKITLDQLTPR